MPTVLNQGSRSVNELLQAVAQLKPEEAEHFFAQAQALRAHRRAANLSSEETALLRQINRGLPARVQQRFDELSARRRDATLSAEEQREFLQLVNRIEKADARRVEWLGELALWRGQSLREVMQELGIGNPGYF